MSWKIWDLSAMVSNGQFTIHCPQETHFSSFMTARPLFHHSQSHPHRRPGHRAHLMADRVVRADSLAFTAPDTFFRINMGLPFTIETASLGAYLLAGMSHTAPAFVRNHVAVHRTGIACRRDHLYQRRFIIFLIDITLVQPLGQMGPAHSPAGGKVPWPYGCVPLPPPSLSVNTVPVSRGFRSYYFIRQGFHIILQIFRSICQIGYFLKNTPGGFALPE